MRRALDLILSWRGTVFIFLGFVILALLNSVLAFLLSGAIFAVFVLFAIAESVKRDGFLPKNPFRFHIPTDDEMRATFVHIRPFFASMLGFVLTMAATNRVSVGWGE